MKKVIGLFAITLSSIVLAGCSSTSPAPAPSNVDTLTQSHNEFVQQFEACETNPENCDLNREAVFEGTITRIYEPSAGEFANFVEIQDNQGNKNSIPILPDTQQKRSTVLINQSGDTVSFEEINVGDGIKASVKSFDRIENGQLTEKLGQYGLIQITVE